MSLDDIFEFIMYLSPVFLIVGVSVGTYFYESLSKVYKILLLYLWVCLMIDLLGHISAITLGNNLVFIPIFGIVELVIISLLYRKFLLVKNKALGVIILLAVSYMLYELVHLTYFEPTKFQSYARVIDTFLLVSMSLLYTFQKVRQEPNMNYFSLNSTILIYFSVNLIIFLPINFLINEASMLKFYFWIANLIFTLLFYAALTLIIWKHGKTQRQLRFGFQ